MVRSLGDGEVPLCRSWGTEVYRFTWDSSFDGNAVVRIARFSDEIMLSRVYRPSHFARTERSDASLTVADWARLQDALIAANFWVLEPHGEAHALDGAYWDDRGPAQGHFSRRASMEPARCDPRPRPAVLRVGRATAGGSRALLSVLAKPAVQPVHPEAQTKSGRSE